MIKKCVVCGGEFVARGKAKVCINRACQIELHRRQPSWQKKLEARRDHLTAVRMSKKCDVCKGPLEKRRHKYCAKCAPKVQRNQIREHCKRRFRPSTARTHERSCVVCEGIFKFTPIGKNKVIPKTCSSLCSEENKKRTARAYRKKYAATPSGAAIIYHHNQVAQAKRQIAVEFLREQLGNNFPTLTV